MLRALRLRLGLLYLAASLGLVILLGAGSYGLMALDLQRSTDLALEYKMAVEFRLRGLPLPAALATAEQAWTQGGEHPDTPTPTEIPVTPAFTATNTPAAALFPASSAGTVVPASSNENDHESEGENPSSETQPVPSARTNPTGGTTLITPGAAPASGEEDDRYDGSLAPVFVVPENNTAANSTVPIVNEPAAITQAQKTGSDLRTISLDNGTRLRLLTYRNASGGVLQVGRLLTDQDRLLSQYLLSLLIMGSAVSLVLALASWLLAGRTIKPAQRAWDQQQLFIANASHELRAPLTLLRASADYALRNPDVAEREKSLGDIIGEVDYMNRLVEDLLLLSRLDAQRLNLAAELVSVPDLLQETARQVELLATTRGVKLNLDPGNGQVQGDPLRLRQVLLILLDNALRFTPPDGAITLSGTQRGKGVEILVSDTGRGIPAQDLPHMFERFYQVADQPQEGRGNGLGLSIARSLVESHHGRIRITSQPGKGTQVRIVLPAV